MGLLFWFEDEDESVVFKFLEVLVACVELDARELLVP